MRDPDVFVDFEEIPCDCGHMPASHQYSDGTFKSFCDDCPCKAYRERVMDEEEKR